MRDLPLEVVFWDLTVYPHVAHLGTNRGTDTSLGTDILPRKEDRGWNP